MTGQPKSHPCSVQRKFKMFQNFLKKISAKQIQIKNIDSCSKKKSFHFAKTQVCTYLDYKIWSLKNLSRKLKFTKVHITN